MARTLDVYTLDVYMVQQLVGHLVQDDGGQMLFRYAPAWLESSERFPISRSLPLKEEEFKQKECKGFFGGILPEQSNRTVIAKILQISAKNDFAMLERIGGECAGAQNKIAMKIDGQVNPDLIYPKEIEAFAKDVSLGVAATRRSVSDLAELVREKAAQVEQPDETAEKLAKLIAGRCENVISRFK